MTNADRFLDSRIRSAGGGARTLEGPVMKRVACGGPDVAPCGGRLSRGGAEDKIAENVVPETVAIPKPNGTASLLGAVRRFFSDWTIRGRSSRAEFWWVVLCVNLPVFLLGAFVAGTSLEILTGIVSLLLLWPWSALLGRRFHDMGVSAGWGVALVLSVVGTGILRLVCPRVEFWALGVSLELLILLINLKEGMPGDNNYGARCP